MEGMNPLVLAHGQDGEADGHGPSRRRARAGRAFRLGRLWSLALVSRLFFT